MTSDFTALNWGTALYSAGPRPQCWHTPRGGFRLLFVLDHELALPRTAYEYLHGTCGGVLVVGHFYMLRSMFLSLVLLVHPLPSLIGGC